MRPATRTPRPRYSGRLDRPSSSYGSALRPLGGPPGAAAPVSSRIHSGSRRLPLLGLPGLGGGPAGATTLSHIGGWSSEAKNSFSSACASGVTPFFGAGGGTEKAPVLDEPLSSEEKVPGPYEGAGGSAGWAGDSYGLSSKPDRNEESRKDPNEDSEEDSPGLPDSLESYDDPYKSEPKDVEPKEDPKEDSLELELGLDEPNDESPNDPKDDSPGSGAGSGSGTSVPKRGVVPFGPGSATSDDPYGGSVRSTGSKTERSTGAGGTSAGAGGTAGKPPVCASSSSSADQDPRGSLTDGKPGASASSPEIAGSGPVVSSGVEYWSLWLVAGRHCPASPC